MADPLDVDDLVDRVVHRSRLTRSEAAQVVDEVIAFLDETLEAYVRRRHGEMQREGRSNAEIFARLADEATARRFRVARLSERQIRRLIYG